MTSPSLQACQLIVRASLANIADRNSFDHWYETEHLPDALKAFKARRAWRGWSQTNPLVHFAFYEFANLAEAEAIQFSPALTALIAEFDRMWGKRVIRTREVIEIAGTLETT
jgi:hypothetical protein